MQIRDRIGGWVGWMQYRIEVRDTAGNVDRLISNGGRIRDFAEHVYQPGPLKVTVRPREFISAGYVTNQAPEFVQEMEISERATKLGMEKLFFLAKAEYDLHEGTPNLHVGPPLAANVLMNTTNSSAGWDIHLAARRPTLIAIYPETEKLEGFDARLRERTRQGNGEAICEMYRPPYESRSLGAKRLLKQFETTLTSTTNRLEAEIVARHLPVEFLIELNAQN